MGPHDFAMGVGSCVGSIAAGHRRRNCCCRMQVKVLTEKECILGVSFWPDVAYNAEGGEADGAAFPA